MVIVENYIKLKVLPIIELHLTSFSHLKHCASVSVTAIKNGTDQFNDIGTVVMA